MLIDEKDLPTVWDIERSEIICNWIVEEPYGMLSVLVNNLQDKFTAHKNTVYYLYKYKNHSVRRYSLRELKNLMQILDYEIGVIKSTKKKDNEGYRIVFKATVINKNLYGNEHNVREPYFRRFFTPNDIYNVLKEIDMIGPENLELIESFNAVF